MEQYLLALDQGTTSSRAILFDTKGRPVQSAQSEFTQIYPKEGSRTLSSYRQQPSPS